VNYTGRSCVVEMSEIKYCVKCGAQLASNAKFCVLCGTSMSAPPAQGISALSTKKTPKVWIVAIVVIILAFLGGASIAPERIVTVTTTTTLPSVATVTKTLVTTAVATPQQVKLGQTFVYVYENVPFEVTFTEFRYADKVGFITADKGYKFAVLYVMVKNSGTKESRIYFGEWTSKVDKGYTYKPESTWNLPSSLRPEETKTGYVYFQILQDATVVEIRCSRSVYVSADIILTP